MPGEIVGEVFLGVLRFIGRIVFEVFIEFAIRGMGYLICRIFDQQVDPEARLVAVVGFLFWVGLGVAAYFGYTIFLV